MTNPTPETILRNRHNWRFRYFEPWPAIDEQGNELNAHVTIELSIHDAINMERVAWAAKGLDHVGRDEDLMLDFMAVHCAVVVDETGKQLTFIEV
jgi:stalled ribosome rescue protein Dom34